jgi:hypothetical protein
MPKRYFKKIEFTRISKKYLDIFKENNLNDF